MAQHQLPLVILSDLFAVCKLPPDAAYPVWAVGPFVCLARTADELSVVCPQAAVPAGVTCEGNWRCLRVAGTIPFLTTGVLTSLADPLAGAGISVFAVSTFDTDYLLVKAGEWERAAAVLREAGHTLTPA